DPGELIAMLDNLDVTAACYLLGAQRGNDAGTGLIGPVGARLDHSAGGQRAHGHVGTENEQLVVAARRSELNVGILARLDAGAERNRCGERERESGLTHPTLSRKTRRRPSQPSWSANMPERLTKEKSVLLGA